MQFQYTKNERGASFGGVFDTIEDARSFQRDLATICGGEVFRQKDQITFFVGLDRLDEAIILLEQAGFSTEDVEANDPWDEEEENPDGD